MAESPLQETYNSEIMPDLMKRRQYKNALQVPRLEKIIVNTAVSGTSSRDVLQEAEETLALITGQKPVQTVARKSVSQFRVRQGYPIGARVTLRRTMMYNFLHRLINIGLPRVRDFRGVSAESFDGAGNYSMGLEDQSVFPEINLDKAKNTIGMNITIVTTANTDEEARELLTHFGMPFAGS